MDNEFEKLGQGRPLKTDKKAPSSRRPPQWYKAREPKSQSLPARIIEEV
jgi:hypothetical protein